MSVYICIYTVQEMGSRGWEEFDSNNDNKLGNIIRK